MRVSELSFNQRRRFLRICYELYITQSYNAKENYSLNAEEASLPEKFCREVRLNEKTIVKYANQYLNLYATTLEVVEFSTVTLNKIRQEQEKKRELKKYYFDIFVNYVHQKKRLQEVARRNNISVKQLKSEAHAYYEEVIKPLDLSLLEASQRALYENYKQKYLQAVQVEQEKRYSDMLTELDPTHAKNWCKKIFQFYESEYFLDHAEEEQFFIDGIVVSKRQIFLWKTKYYYQYATSLEKKECILVDEVLLGNHKNIFTYYLEDAEEYVSILLALKDADTSLAWDFILKSALEKNRIDLYIDIYLKNHASDSDYEEKEKYLKQFGLAKEKEEQESKSLQLFSTNNIKELAYQIHTYMEKAKNKEVRPIDELDIQILEKKYGVLIALLEPYLTKEEQKHLDFLRERRDLNRVKVLVSKRMELEGTRKMMNQEGKMIEIPNEVKQACFDFLEEYQIVMEERLYIELLSRVMKEEFLYREGKIIGDVPFWKEVKKTCD